MRNLKLGLAGISPSHSNSQNNQSRDFTKTDTLEYNYAEYKINLFEIETQEIIVLDANNNKISNQVIKKTIVKKFLGKKSLQIEKWIDYNEDKIFDKYESIKKDFNFLGKEKYSETIVSEDTSEINKPYALPRFKMNFR